MRQSEELPQTERDTFEDVVRDFLLSERELLEKEAAGEPTTGDRPPTTVRFELVDQLLAEHSRRPMGPDRFETALLRLTECDQPQQRDQATEMLARWQDYRLLDQPTAQRRPYEASE